MAFPLDSSTRGVRFYNLTADVSNDRILLTGAYEASDLIPVLLFSVGVPWIEPCVKHICCLWDIAARYRDHDLLAALGPTCDEGANLKARDLMKGNPPSSREWSVRTMIHPSFVAMLFLWVDPAFYIFYEIVPMQWVETSTIRWQASWYGQPCHPVMYPDGRQVCIHCANPKPANAVYVFSANWFATFQCKWACQPGYLGPNCDVALDLAVYSAGGVVAVVCAAALMLCVGLGPRRRVEEVAQVVMEKPVAAPKARSDMIVFKDGGAIQDIRIKLL